MVEDKIFRPWNKKDAEGNIYRQWDDVILWNDYVVAEIKEASGDTVHWHLNTYFWQESL